MQSVGLPHAQSRIELGKQILVRSRPTTQKFLRRQSPLLGLILCVLCVGVVGCVSGSSDVYLLTLTVC